MARFMVSYTFKGRASESINADSFEAAEALIEAKVDNADFHIDADGIDDVNFDVEELHPITRNGKEIWSTWVKVGDIRGHQSALNDTPLFGAA